MSKRTKEVFLWGSVLAPLVLILLPAFDAGLHTSGKAPSFLGEFREPFAFIYAGALLTIATTLFIRGERERSG